MLIEFKDLKSEGYKIVKEIYDYYILNTTATFHTEQLSVDELKSMIPEGHPKYQSFLVMMEGAVCGFCYLSRYKPRQAYDRTAEITVYLKPDYRGRGIGKICLDKLEAIARLKGISVLIGVITAENETSVKLFETTGYQKCAHYSKVGEKFNRILDVVAYQKLL